MTLFAGSVSSSIFSVQRVLRTVAVALVSTCLVACGGGGGSEDDLPIATTNVALVSEASNTSPVQTSVAVQFPSETWDVGVKSTPPTWLTLTWSSSSIHASADPRGLKPGEHRADVDVCAINGLGNCIASAKLAVAFTVKAAQAPTKLSVSRSLVSNSWPDLSFPFESRDEIWTVRSDQPWLIPAQPTLTGMVFANARIPKAMAVAGSQSGKLTFTSASGKTHVIDVTLNVATWSLVVTVGDLSISAAPGAVSPSTAIGIDTSDNSAQPIAATTDQPWLKVTADRTTTPATLRVYAEVPAGMAEGVYTGTVSADVGTAEGRQVAEQKITLRVGAFTAVAEQSRSNVDIVAGTTTDLTVTARTNTSTVFTVTSDQPWLVPSAATASANTALAVSVAPPANMAAGTYSGTITMQGTFDGVNRTLTFPVTMVLTVPTVTLTSRDSLDFNPSNGNQPTAILSYSHNLGAAATTTFTTSHPWLEFYAPSLMLSLASPHGLPVGVHQGSVTATTTAGELSATATLPVTVTIAPNLMSSPAGSVSMSTASGPTPSFTLTTSGNFDGSEPVSYETSEPWLLVSQATAPMSSAVTVSLAANHGLARGTYRASVRAAVTVAGMTDVEWIDVSVIVL